MTNQYEKFQGFLEHQEKHVNSSHYVKEYQPIKSNDISEIVEDIVLNSGLKNKGRQLNKIINLYAGESNGYNSVLLRKSIRGGVYKALGLEGGEKLDKKPHKWILSKIDGKIKFHERKL